MFSDKSHPSREGAEWKVKLGLRQILNLKCDLVFKKEKTAVQQRGLDWNLTQNLAQL